MGRVELDALRDVEREGVRDNRAARYLLRLEGCGDRPGLVGDQGKIVAGAPQGLGEQHRRQRVDGERITRSQIRVLLVRRHMQKADELAHVETPSALTSGSGRMLFGTGGVSQQVPASIRIHGYSRAENGLRGGPGEGTRAGTLAVGEAAA